MARITDVFVSGTLGNLVLYRRMDTNCVRMKRESIQQTPATKIRSLNFGIASKAAASLRRGLTAVIPNPLDRKMQSRFSGAIAKWLGLSNVHELSAGEVTSCISNFGFSDGYTFNERFKVPVTVSYAENSTIVVNIDAFVPVLSVTAPAGTVILELVISVAGCTLATGMPTGSSTQRIQVPYNQNEIAAQALQFKIPAGHGSFTLTAAWLQYYVMKNNGISRTENPAFIPAGVINARYS